MDLLDSKMDDQDLTPYEVTQAPKAVYYLSNFLTQDEESKLWQGVYAAPKPKWTVLSHRRLQNWGGKPHEKGMVPEHMPQWLQELVTTRVSGLGIFGGMDANHVLVNEYCPGQGIM
ncbi:alpha-ketoglutarate-dependent dioxygenase alkB homolog 6-like, partial [Hyalella azteca]|uniref:Alpha-ketoglutarate-dependent dioxygenase alkB homolog 6-like n=1 Tax=Hyalella azteca TaxID=294128 RepID=A0A8B7NGC5_HYAAZ